MKRVDFVVVLEDGVRKRHIHEAENGKVRSFAVQIEVKTKGQWIPVVRYDSAHGFSHIDHYTPDGRKKKTVLDLNLNTAITLADWDVNNNWEQFVKKFLEE